MISDKRCWYNNGEVETLIFPGKEIPENMVPGRIFHHKQYSEEHNKNLSKALTGRQLSEEHKQHISKTAREHLAETGPWNKGLKPSKSSWKKGHIPWNKGMTYEECHRISKEEMTSRIFNTKKLNNSFNKSLPEEDLYDILSEKYGSDDIIRQYSDDRYPFNCDFYIKSIDKFIELNLHPSHNNHPFDANNAADLEELQLLIDNNDDWSKMIIDVWANRDFKKRIIAEQNHLNYLMIYNMNEIRERATTIES